MNYNRKNKEKKEMGFQRDLTSFINTAKCCKIRTQSQQVIKGLKSMI